MLQHKQLVELWKLVQIEGDGMRKRKRVQHQLIPNDAAGKMAVKKTSRFRTTETPLLLFPLQKYVMNEIGHFMKRKESSLTASKKCIGRISYDRLALINATHMTF